MLKSFFLLLLIVASLFFFQPGTVHAIEDEGSGEAGCDPGVGNIDLGSCLTLGKNSTPVSTVYNDPADLVNIIVRNSFIVAGIIIFFLMIYSGYQFLGKDAKGLDEAKSIMTAALAGLVVMFIAYWIVRILEVVLGMQFLTI